MGQKKKKRLGQLDEEELESDSADAILQRAAYNEIYEEPSEEEEEQEARAHELLQQKDDDEGDEDEGGAVEIDQH